ncbi:MAG: 16S rRNA (cytidine(1402)-2'-O)-methyltransferase [Chloroflexi bacterium]|nr:MAG: 16S rRNA (cytidine(1402)-2'-O)-methyltransferase [Chloroflexota bacterium]
MSEAGGAAASSEARGRLLVVGTPIGNLGDLTPRAAEALRTADLVLAEDTRMAARLLAHLGTRTATLSYNAHNASLRKPTLLARLAAGETLALTTDAGMPAISDPGAELVRAARSAGAAIEVVPGPSAVTAAVAVAGVEAGGFLFGGFLPARPASARAATLQRLLDAARLAAVPLVVYEAPHRVAKLLAELGQWAADTQVVLARELTKRHEQVVVGTPEQLAREVAEPRGEYVVVIGGLGAAAPEPTPALDTDALRAAAASAGLSPRSIVELLRAAGVARRDAYRIARQPSTEQPRSRRPKPGLKVR